MVLKLVKLSANDEIISGATATSSSGSVTRLKIWNGPPPSTRAASVSSSGIDWSAPIDTTKKNGTVSQVLTRMHDTFAQLAPKSQGTRRWKRRFTTPNWSLSRPDHTSSERKHGIDHGMITITR